MYDAGWRANGYNRDTSVTCATRRLVARIATERSNVIAANTAWRESGDEGLMLPNWILTVGLTTITPLMTLLGTTNAVMEETAVFVHHRLVGNFKMRGLP
ncbi:MAG: hypothetical protein H6668_24295 [Ardenticatenaceae bacterium]|nr:hypothetical protein [Ardenticatenaceae bacterium]